MYLHQRSVDVLDKPLEERATYDLSALFATSSVLGRAFAFELLDAAAGDVSLSCRPGRLRQSRAEVLDPAKHVSWRKKMGDGATDLPRTGEIVEARVFPSLFTAATERVTLGGM